MSVLVILGSTNSIKAVIPARHIRRTISEKSKIKHVLRIAAIFFFFFTYTETILQLCRIWTHTPYHYFQQVFWFGFGFGFCKKDKTLLTYKTKQKKSREITWTIYTLKPWHFPCLSVSSFLPSFLTVSLRNWALVTLTDYSVSQS